MVVRGPAADMVAMTPSLQPYMGSTAWLSGPNVFHTQPWHPQHVSPGGHSDSVTRTDWQVRDGWKGGLSDTW